MSVNTRAVKKVDGKMLKKYSENEKGVQLVKLLVVSKSFTHATHTTKFCKKRMK
jgi:hypothetical protein